MARKSKTISENPVVASSENSAELTNASSDGTEKPKRASKARAESSKALTHHSEIIVGAGPSGLLYAQKSEGFVLESEDRSLGHTHGLHLVDASIDLTAVPEIEWGETLAPARVRWERQWMAPEDVNWADKSWIGQLPQWKFYLEGQKRLFLKLNLDAEKSLASPVRKLSKENASWRVETVEETFTTNKIVWAAGLVAFQNAYGKSEAQEYLVGNPLYSKEAADFRGGIAGNFSFFEEPLREEGFDLGSIVALPVKHGGKLYLTIGAFHKLESGLWTLLTLTHVHTDPLNDPKEMASLQKSLRRAVRHSFCTESAKAPQEVWIVSPRVGGHIFGNPWVFGSGDLKSTGCAIEFVGDETLRSLIHSGPVTQSAVHSHLAGALKRTEILTERSDSKSSNSSASVPENSSEMPQVF